MEDYEYDGEEELEELEELVDIPLQLQKVNVRNLKVHKLSKSIYRERKTSKEIKLLAENMRIVGQLEPIIVSPQYVILSGVRRFYAALQLGLNEVIAIIKDVPKEIEAEIIVSHNKQRKKTARQIMNEAEAVLGILGVSQGQRNDLLKKEKRNPFGKVGKNRFEIAIKVLALDCSSATLRRMISVSEFEKESKEQRNLGLLDRMINKELTPSRAATLANDYKKQKKEQSKALANIKSKNKASKYKVKDNSSLFEIFNKSSHNMEDVTDSSVQVVVTSPPYWNLRNYGNSTAEGERDLGLERNTQEFINAMSIHLRDVKRVLKDTGSFFLNMGDTYRVGQNYLIPTRLFLNLCDNEGWFAVNEIIWKKSTGVPQGKTKRLQPIYEKVYHLVKDPENYYYEEFKNWRDNEKIGLVMGPANRNASSTKKTKRGYMLTKSYDRFKDFLDEQIVTSVINGKTAATRQLELKKLDPFIDHPALMPIYLPMIPILTTSKEGDTVLDPFSGSGTTGKAAMILGRKYIGYELNEKFYNLSIQDLSNTEKVLIGDKENLDFDFDAEYDFETEFNEKKENKLGAGLNKKRGRKVLHKKNIKDDKD